MKPGWKISRLNWTWMDLIGFDVIRRYFLITLPGLSVVIITSSSCFLNIAFQPYNVLDHSTDKGLKGLGLLLLDEMKNWGLFPLDWPTPPQFHPPHQFHTHTLSPHANQIPLSCFFFLSETLEVKGVVSPSSFLSNHVLPIESGQTSKKERAIEIGAAFQFTGSLRGVQISEDVHLQHNEITAESCT